MRHRASAAAVLLGIASSACWSGRQEGERTKGASVGGGALIWSLPDGRGGTNELCRALACLPWLTAATHGRLVTGDFNGDRAVDVAREVDGGIVVSIGSGSGFRELAARRSAARDRLGAQLLPLGDVDGDGRHDVLALVIDAPPTEGHPKVLPRARAPQLVLLRGTPDGLAPPEPLVSLDGWWSDLRIAVGDLDGDRRPDVALAGVRYEKEPVLAGLRGKPGGLETAFSWSFPARGVMDRIAIADMDGDGIGDLLAFGTGSAPSSWSRWPGGPGGPQSDRRQTWADPSGKRQSWFAGVAAVGQFDGNTVEAAVSALGVRTIFIYRAGSSKPDREIASGTSADFGEALAAVDLNADGRDELVVFASSEVLAFTGARADAVLARQPRSP
ncbi:MAG TPA: VCBS repeat-containing protein [Kofleriaceae bacterium]|nr:VCBS repeat-containing protein [Kofleriaceae bacterium]